MNRKIESAASIAFGLLLAVFAGAADNKVCNTTKTASCTANNEACTVEKTVCTEFLADGHTKVTTTTSHDCGPGGPQQCPQTSKPARLSRYGRITATTVKIENPRPRRGTSPDRIQEPANRQ